MRGIFLGDCRPLGLESGLPGGVVKRSSLETFRDLVPGGDLNSVSRENWETPDKYSQSYCEGIVKIGTSLRQWPKFRIS